MLHGVEHAHLTRSWRPCCCSGLEDLERLRRGEVDHHAAAVAGCLHDLERDGVRVLDRPGLGEALGRDALLLGDGQEAALDVLGAGHLRLDQDQLLDALADQVLGGAGDAVARAHVDGRVVRRAVALRRDAGPDHVVAVGLVVLVVDRALDDARAADDAGDLLGLDQLLGGRGGLRRVGLLGLLDQLDRPAVDAAVVVDALEVRLGRLGDLGEVGAGLLGVDRTELDRVAGGRLAVAQAALGGLLLAGLAGEATAVVATAAAAVVVVVATGGYEERESNSKRRQHDDLTRAAQHELDTHGCLSSSGLARGSCRSKPARA